MTITAIAIHTEDTVLCLLRDHHAGECPVLASGTAPALTSDTPMGHKVSRIAHARGAPVIKFGAVIGHATKDIAEGEHVHLHNLQGAFG